MSKEFCYLTFGNISQVIRAEQYLKTQRIPFMVVPIPRSISSDCGMCIMGPAAAKESFSAALQQAGIVFDELFILKQNNSYYFNLFKQYEGP